MDCRTDSRNHTLGTVSYTHLDVYKRQGLLFYGSTILPFVDHFPKNTELYRIMTTKPQELKKKEDE